MRYVLYGAGPYMRNRVDEDKAKYFDYIVDKNPDYIGTRYCGLEIKSPKILEQERDKDVFIVIYAFAKLYDIEHELVQMGFVRNEGFVWEKKLRNLYPNHQLWMDKNSDHWQKDEAAWRAFFDIGDPSERSELISKMINWGGVKSVLDLGAGQENMRPYLPKTVEYYPVDYKPLSENTIVCDFNKKEFPDLTGDIVLLIGVFGYIDEGMWLIDRASKSVNPGGLLVVTFAYFNSYYSAYDFLKDKGDKFQLEDYAFRTEEYGIFTFRRID